MGKLKSVCRYLELAKHDAIEECTQVLKGKSMPMMGNRLLSSVQVQVHSPWGDRPPGSLTTRDTNQVILLQSGVGREQNEDEP